MPHMVLLASYLSINAVDVSEHSSKIELSVEVSDEDATTFRSLGWKEVLGGIKEGSLSATFKQDIAAGELDATMWPLLGNNVPFEVRLSDAAVGPNNPKYTGTVLMKKWAPIAGQVGSIAEVDVEWPTSGQVSRTVS
ncbi:hypothetical protein SAMN04489729_4810 [Amycolatopsis lurida]|uniref:Phage tail protein n=1 Tax=Amycolatopsis lurida NRRL 2430 TaxID=1460371 RepID=A0A2P2FWF5_AMYLU|nr:hypothetical protein [Amycolatopsis lurida]KFU81015.1 hypothetical protein BB31_11580 [Amycolatopsis lurida NRRL 2430]SED60327.1 hypothetical protein SAMN04489729_4810 [Amycolatopsis lurida]